MITKSLSLIQIFAIFFVSGALFLILFSAPRNIDAVRRTIQKPANNLGLIGYWSFNEGTSTRATDFSGRGNYGTLLTDGAALPTWVNGKRGKGISLNGTDQQVDMGDIAVMDGLTAVTVSAWIKASSANANDGNFPIIAGKSSCGQANPDGPFQIFLSSGRNPQFIAYAQDNTTIGAGDFVTDVDDGNWHFLVGAYDGDFIYMWVDGVLVHSNDVATYTLSSTANTFEVGGDCNGSFRHYDGAVDEVRAYNRALSPTEIVALGKTGAVKFNSSSVSLQKGSSLENGLVGLWTFDGGDTSWTSDTTGTTRDRSGNNNTGTFTSMNRRTAVDGGKLGQAMTFDGTNDLCRHTQSSTVRLRTHRSFHACCLDQCFDGWRRSSLNEIWFIYWILFSVCGWLPRRDRSVHLFDGSKWPRRTCTYRLRYRDGARVASCSGSE